jgi:hypothetical protein
MAIFCERDLPVMGSKIILRLENKSIAFTFSLIYKNIVCKTCFKTIHKKFADFLGLFPFFASSFPCFFSFGQPCFYPFLQNF